MMMENTISTEETIIKQSDQPLGKLFYIKTKNVTLEECKFKEQLTLSDSTEFLKFINCSIKEHLTIKALNIKKLCFENMNCVKIHGRVDSKYWVELHIVNCINLSKLSVSGVRWLHINKYDEKFIKEMKDISELSVYNVNISNRNLRSLHLKKDSTVDKSIIQDCKIDNLIIDNQNTKLINVRGSYLTLNRIEKISIVECEFVSLKLIDISDIDMIRVIENIKGINCIDLINSYIKMTQWNKKIEKLNLLCKNIKQLEVFKVVNLTIEKYSFGIIADDCLNSLKFEKCDVSDIIAPSLNSLKFEGNTKEIEELYEQEKLKNENNIVKIKDLYKKEKLKNESNIVKIKDLYKKEKLKENCDLFLLNCELDEKCFSFVVKNLTINYTDKVIDKIHLIGSEIENLNIHGCKTLFIRESKILKINTCIDNLDETVEVICFTDCVPIPEQIVYNGERKRKMKDIYICITKDETKNIDIKTINQLYFKYPFNLTIQYDPDKVMKDTCEIVNLFINEKGKSYNNESSIFNHESGIVNENINREKFNNTLSFKYINMEGDIIVKESNITCLKFKYITKLNKIYYDAYYMIFSKCTHIPEIFNDSLSKLEILDMKINEDIMKRLFDIHNAQDTYNIGFKLFIKNCTFDNNDIKDKMSQISTMS